MMKNYVVFCVFFFFFVVVVFFFVFVFLFMDKKAQLNTL